MRKYIIMVVIVVMSLTVGCGVSDPIVKGNIVEINADSGAIMVESTSDDMVGPVWVVYKNTKYKSGVSKEFAVGNYVEVSIEAAVAQSYPPQAIAKKININKK